jgi:hypothetical protein
MESLETLNWRLIAFGAVWLTGLSLVLAVAGFAMYDAGLQGATLRQVLSRPRYQAAMSGGLALFCTGMAGSGGPWLERLLWLALGAGFVWMSWQAWSRREREPAMPRADAGPPPDTTEDQSG